MRSGGIQGESVGVVCSLYAMVSYDYSYLRFSVFLVRVQPVSQLVICFAGVRISEIRPFLPKAASPSDLFPTLPQFDMSHMRAGQAFYQMPV